MRGGGDGGHPAGRHPPAHQEKAGRPGAERGGQSEHQPQYITGETESSELGHLSLSQSESLYASLQPMRGQGLLSPPISVIC